MLSNVDFGKSFSREEKEEFEEKVKERRKADTVEVSEEGKMLLEENTDLSSGNILEIKVDGEKEPVTYTKTGEVSRTEEAAFSVSV